MMSHIFPQVSIFLQLLRKQENGLGNSALIGS